MEGENGQNQAPVEQQEVPQQQMDPNEQANLEQNEAQEQQMLQQQAASLAEVKKRRKE